MSDELIDVVDELMAPAFDEPKAGATLWAFHTKDVDRSLEPDEVAALVKKGKGVYVVELVWDEDLDLVQRGDGVRVRSLKDLKALRDGRFKHMVDSVSSSKAAGLARDPSLAARAPTSTAAKASTPWHPGMLQPGKRGR